MNRIRLSPNFYLDEFIRSETAVRHGIDIVVTPDSDVFNNLIRLCRDVLQPIRNSLGPVHITSGYRPAEVNHLIGGSKRSRHVQALAADIVVTGHTPYNVCEWIRHAYLSIDQCIHEFGHWTHVGIAPLDEAIRRQLLTAYKKPSLTPGQRPKTAYINGIHRIEELL
jgi:hypothetical protein